MCNFCNEERDSERIDKSATSYICAKCVQLLINQSQENLLKAYNLAVRKGYSDKARAIKSFLEVSADEPINRYAAKRINGKRFMRVTWNDKKTSRRFKKREGITLYQIEQRKPVVP